MNVNDNSYYDILDNIGQSRLIQQGFIDYIKKNDLSRNQRWNIFILLSDLYGFAKESSYDLDFSELYDWLLDEMFKEYNYDYSKSYKFVKLLKCIKSNDKCVYNDVIDRIRVDNYISVCIAISSTYHNDFYKYTDIMELFFEKIILSLKFNSHKEEIRKDFKFFMKEYLSMKNYRKYKIHFLRLNF